MAPWLQCACGAKASRGRVRFIAFLLGASGALAFAPLSWYPLAVIAPAGLFWLWLNRGPGETAWLGFVFGLGWFGAGVHWIWYSAYAFGGTPLPVAILINLGLVAFLAAYPAALGGIVARRLRALPPLRFALSLASAWVLLEFLRGVLFTGFTWLNPGYALGASVLAGYAPIGGVNLVAWVGLLSAALLAVWGSGRLPVRWLALAAALWVAGGLLGKVDWTQDEGRRLDVALVQGDVSQDQKWRPDSRWATVEKYLRLSASQLDADLIVWPETALPMFFDQAQPALMGIDRIAAARGTGLLIGVPTRDPDGSYYNSVVGLGAVHGRYDKRHLVPFGEYVPLASLLDAAIQFLDVPMSNFAVGAPAQAVFKLDDVSIATTICFEDAFAPETHTYLGDADVLLNVSNDAWFGPTWAPAQHLQMAQMRAIEAGRGMMRATNTGITALISAQGDLIAVGESWQATVVRAELPLYKGKTPYARAGDAVWAGIAVLLFVISQVSLRRR